MSFQPGDRVFAKMKGFSEWPARVNPLPPHVNVPKGKLPIFFYGAHQVCFIPIKAVFHFEENKEKWGKPKSNSQFNDALIEIETNPEIFMLGRDPDADEFLKSVYPDVKKGAPKVRNHSGLTDVASVRSLPMSGTSDHESRDDRSCILAETEQLADSDTCEGESDHDESYAPQKSANRKTSRSTTGRKVMIQPKKNAISNKRRSKNGPAAQKSSVGIKRTQPRHSSQCVGKRPRRFLDNAIDVIEEDNKSISSISSLSDNEDDPLASWNLADAARKNEFETKLQELELKRQKEEEKAIRRAEKHGSSRQSKHQLRKRQNSLTKVEIQQLSPNIELADIQREPSISPKQANENDHDDFKLATEATLVTSTASDSDRESKEARRLARRLEKKEAKRAAKKEEKREMKRRSKAALRERSITGDTQGEASFLNMSPEQTSVPDATCSQLAPYSVNLRNHQTNYVSTGIPSGPDLTVVTSGHELALAHQSPKLEDIQRSPSLSSEEDIKITHNTAKILESDCECPPSISQNITVPGTNAEPAAAEALNAGCMESPVFQSNEGKFGSILEKVPSSDSDSLEGIQNRGDHLSNVRFRLKHRKPKVSDSESDTNSANIEDNLGVEKRKHTEHESAGFIAVSNSKAEVDVYPAITEAKKTLPVDHVAKLNNLSRQLKAKLLRGHEDFPAAIAVFDQICSFPATLLELTQAWDLTDCIKKCRRYKLSSEICRKAQSVLLHFQSIQAAASTEELKRAKVIIEERSKRSKLASAFNAPVIQDENSQCSPETKQSTGQRNLGMPTGPSKSPSSNLEEKRASIKAELDERANNILSKIREADERVAASSNKSPLLTTNVLGKRSHHHHHHRNSCAPGVPVGEEDDEAVISRVEEVASRFEASTKRNAKRSLLSTSVPTHSSNQEELIDLDLDSRIHRMIGFPGGGDQVVGSPPPPPPPPPISFHPISDQQPMTSKLPPALFAKRALIASKVAAKRAADKKEGTKNGLQSHSAFQFLSSPPPPPPLPAASMQLASSIATTANRGLKIENDDAIYDLLGV